MTVGNERRVAVIIEDDSDIRNLLETVLTQAGFDTVPVSNGMDGVAAVSEHNPVVTTLDVSMPGIDGFETAKRIRAFSQTYIVMLTARDEEIDTLQGLDAGADDYVTKPFRPRELRARIEAMLRRPRVLPPDVALSAAGAGHPASPPEPAVATVATVSPATGDELEWVEHNGLRINMDMRMAELEGAELVLTRSEFELLAALVESGRRVHSKAELALLLRGESYATGPYVSESDKRAVEVHMGNLRRKLGDSISSPRWIETVRGVGYRLAARA
ncbi:MtrAB system response regulator MtrA [Okibacterium endophyticum]